MYSPDLCPNMIAAQAKLVYQLNKYYTERCQARKAAIAKTIREVCKVVSDVLKEVEVQEPRFISSLSEIDARYEGLEVISPTEFEVVLYLNQMGVFNFVDDGSLPGCAVLKLSDGRKRSMSLWVEFITASGYLSARKIRSRFQTLVAQAVETQTSLNVLCPCDSPDKNVGVGHHALQGIFLTQTSLNVSCIDRWFFTTSASWEAHSILTVSLIKT